MELIDKLTAIADGLREANGITNKLSLDDMAYYAKKPQGIALVEDIPNTAGQWACLARASQMRDIKYTVKGDLHVVLTNTTDGIVATKGEEVTGLWYSSVRGTDWGFIGYGVTMYSLMTCFNNPKSFVYTKKYKDYWSDSYNLGNVYGVNCTDFVSYCIDLPYLTVTDRLPYLECMLDENGKHNMDGMCWDSVSGEVDTEKLRTELKLCDVLNSAEEWGGTAGHAVIVTGIRRDNNGNIQEIELSEANVPFVISTNYSWDDFVYMYIKHFGYRAYRYSNLENVTFPENLTNIVYSGIVTNRGDKISIRPDQDISLNVLGDGYAGIVLFKDGIQIDKQESTDDWELTNLTTGKYTAILYKSGESVTIKSVNETNSTSFIVCDVSISRTDNDFTYTAESIDGTYLKPMQIAVKDYHGYTLDTLILDIDDFSGNGNTTFEMNDTATTNGAIIHVPFKTEYGFVIAECTI